MKREITYRREAIHMFRLNARLYAGSMRLHHESQC